MMQHPTPTTIVIPPLATPWPGQGGIYAGLRITPDGSQLYALILSHEIPEADEDGRTWRQGLDWAATVEAEGHRDFVMPDRFETLQLIETVRQHLPKYGRMWTSTQSSAALAFTQNFNYGYQSYADKKARGCVRAVRRLKLDPSILLSGAATK
jgi:hypothetical protein